MPSKGPKHHRTTDWDAINAQLREGGNEQGEGPEKGIITREDSDLRRVWLMTKTYEDGTIQRWLQRKSDKDAMNEES